mgnify:CR=1 FL=1
MFTVILANFLTGMLASIFVLVAVLMILIVLIQKPKGGGLSGAFGAGGGSDQAMFGAKAGDVFTWITVVFFVMFLGLGIGLVYATRAESQKIVPDSDQVVPVETNTGSGPGSDPTTGDGTTEVTEPVEIEEPGPVTPSTTE